MGAALPRDLSEDSRLTERDSGFESIKAEVPETSSDEENARPRTRRPRPGARDVTSPPQVTSQAPTSEVTSQEPEDSLPNMTSQSAEQPSQDVTSQEPVTSQTATAKLNLQREQPETDAVSGSEITSQRRRERFVRDVTSQHESTQSAGAQESVSARSNKETEVRTDPKEPESETKEDEITKDELPEKRVAEKEMDQVKTSGLKDEVDGIKLAQLDGGRVIQKERTPKSKGRLPQKLELFSNLSDNQPRKLAPKEGRERSGSEPPSKSLGDEVWKSRVKSRWQETPSARKTVLTKVEMSPANRKAANKQEAPWMQEIKSRGFRQPEVKSKQEVVSGEKAVRTRQVNRMTFNPGSKVEAPEAETVTFKDEMAPREEVMHKQEANKIVIKKPQVEKYLQEEKAPREEVVHKPEVKRITLGSVPGSASEVKVKPRPEIHTAVATFQVKPEAAMEVSQAFTALNLTVDCNTGEVHTSSKEIHLGAVRQEDPPPLPGSQPMVSTKIIHPMGNKDTNGIHIAKVSPMASRRAQFEVIIQKDKTGAQTNVNVSASQVESAPVFTRKMQDLEVCKGDNARFECHVTGSPRPDITWFKDDEPLAQRRRKYVTDVDDTGRCSLIVKNCTEHDDAVYEVRASNSAGKAECSAELFVETGQ